MTEIDIEIDGLHNSVLHRATTEVLATRVESYQNLTTLQRHKIFSWQFDWDVAFQRQSSDVFSLLVNGSELVQDSICIEDTGDHVFVHLIESAPHNVGEQKLYRAYLVISSHSRVAVHSIWVIMDTSRSLQSPTLLSIM